MWCQIWRLISQLYILSPGHLTCSFVCHCNSTESIQYRRQFSALNLSYTLPSLSVYQILVYAWDKWSAWGRSDSPRGTTSRQCPNIERRKTWYFSDNPALSGVWIRSTTSDIGKAPHSNHCATSLSYNFRNNFDDILYMDQRRRQWDNIKPSLSQPLMFAG